MQPVLDLRFPRHSKHASKPAKPHRTHEAQNRSSWSYPALFGGAAGCKERELSIRYVDLGDIAKAERVISIELRRIGKIGRRDRYSRGRVNDPGLIPHYGPLESRNRVDCAQGLMLAVSLDIEHR